MKFAPLGNQKNALNSLLTARMTHVNGSVLVQRSVGSRALIDRPALNNSKNHSLQVIMSQCLIINNINNNNRKSFALKARAVTSSPFMSYPDLTLYDKAKCLAVRDLGSRLCLHCETCQP